MDKKLKLLKIKILNKQNLILKSKLLFLGLIILLLQDLLLIMFVDESYLENHSIMIIPNFLELSLSRNQGGAFNLLQNFPWLIILISTCIIIVLFFIIITSLNKFIIWGAMFMLYGSLWHWSDRVINGYVKDFLFFIPFNIVIDFADISISFGFLLFLIGIFYKKKKYELKD